MPAPHVRKRWHNAELEQALQEYHHPRTGRVRLWSLTLCRRPECVEDWPQEHEVSFVGVQLEAEQLKRWPWLTYREEKRGLPPPNIRLYGVLLVEVTEYQVISGRESPFKTATFSVVGTTPAEWADRLKKESPAIRKLLANAGIGGRKKLEDEDWPYWRDQADRAIALRDRGYTWQQVLGNLGEGATEKTVRRWVKTRRQELRK